MPRQFLLLLIDAALMSLAFIGAVLLRDNFESSLPRILQFTPQLLMTLAAGIPACLILGLNRTIWRLSTMGDHLRILAVAICVPLVVMAMGFGFNRLEGVARSLPVLQGLLMLCSMIGVRVVARLFLGAVHRARAPSDMVAPVTASGQTILLVGVDSSAELYLRAAGELGSSQIRIAGVLADTPRQVGRLLHQSPIIGTIKDIVAVLRDLEVHGVHVDRVVVTTGFARLSAQARRALQDLKSSGIARIEFLSELFGFDGQTGSQPALQAAASSEVSRLFADDATDLLAPPSFGYRFGKRVFDIALALALMVILAIPMLCVALITALNVGLPVVFWQQRPGLQGRPFRLYKFRTMASAHDGSGRRLADSQRLSIVGKFMRRTRLDELPQLYNIMIGEMSFVGPRPLLPLDQPDGQAARLMVRPGLTGWGQVQGGREISAADKAALDVWYVQHASFLLDLEIMLRTIPMLIKGERVNFGAIQLAWSDLRARGICVPPPNVSSQMGAAHAVLD
jgi:lipopolysaccharide/colanic/teichoic acid biosynthesis glycosyltransferase